MFKEFKEFAMRGNVVDLAIGVIIGAAFSKIIDSLVGDIIMPIIGAITGGLDFSNHFIGLSRPSRRRCSQRRRTRCCSWLGQFFDRCAKLSHHCVHSFLVVRALNKLKKAEAPAAPAPLRSEILLEEIRDALERKRGVSGRSPGSARIPLTKKGAPRAERLSVAMGLEEIPVVLKKTAAGSCLGRSLVKAFASFGVARLYSTIPRAWPP